MSKLYHLPFNNDNVAHNTRMQLRDAVRATGGDTHVSPSFGHGTAFIVATLPDDVDPASIFGELEHFEVEGEDDKPEEGTGDSTGVSDGDQGTEQGSESGEAAPLGSDQGSAE